MDIAAIKKAAHAADSQAAWPFNEKTFHAQATPAAVLALIASHEQLVAALREAIEIIQSIDQTDNTCDARIDVSDFRAALAAAGAA